MIVQVVLRGAQRSTRTVAYLYGPGRANEHTDPHLVASWHSAVPDPGRSPTASTSRLARQIDLPVLALPPYRRPSRATWHVSARAAPEDPLLSDIQWAAIARRLVAAGGIAPAGDEEACRWIAVRHAADHIHLLATIVREDGRRAHVHRDVARLRAEADRIEVEYGLRRLPRSDGTVLRHTTTAEHCKAERLGRRSTARDRLRAAVRIAVATSVNEQEFFSLLATFGIQVEQRCSASGAVIGYKVSVPGDVNRDGRPIWFSGGRLAPDLSLPRIRARLDAAEVRPSSPGGSSSWHRAARALAGVPAGLAPASPAPEAAGRLAALGSMLDAAAAVMAPGAAGGVLEAARSSFDNAVRCRIRADHRAAGLLSSAAREVLRTGTPPSAETAALIVEALTVAVAAALQWHRAHGHTHQARAAELTVTHLQAAHRATGSQVGIGFGEARDAYGHRGRTAPGATPLGNPNQRR